ncbi:ring-exported protein 4, putative [Plasmodium vivax]|uniref:Ring-exported protein 4 n=5 Tax=Plasmodium vivax TaxID=5855 RepID=A5KDR6_PLAVS|nr:hypothetical protein, conserved [Plasmodium vivax]KMZ81590.1 hypothetical protein PVIIG_04680 [Plasmodium vivax India VII]KMZ87808.1 hypothetical protein PVBG_05060 [Plasmodium vivax Brazil I]KNA00619.1 hypothetical protein PVNG_03216 [Plasmodium vivax North Korean]EDL42362.1 hypothetical protein, conserved [Plasmodium vivax]CAG9481905.1 unnamed protein product [Plasmodium vivax]|eukprot:XP_001608386.1 hypothetical protein [Plasmodium vivax Sal-1]
MYQHKFKKCISVFQKRSLTRQNSNYNFFFIISFCYPFIYNSLGINEFDVSSRVSLKANYSRNLSDNNLSEIVVDIFNVIDYNNYDDGDIEHLENDNYETRLRNEWNQLENDENIDWLTITLKTYESFVGKNSQITPETEIRHIRWCNIVDALYYFRKAQNEEHRAGLEFFLDALREKMQERDIEDLNEEEEESWNHLKMAKVKENNEWKNYQLLTWKYWNQAESAESARIIRQ